MFPAKSRTWRQCGGLVNTDFILGDSRSRQCVKGLLCEPPRGHLALWQLERSCQVIEIVSDNTPLVCIFYPHPGVLMGKTNDMHIPEMGKGRKVGGRRVEGGPLARDRRVGRLSL